MKKSLLKNVELTFSKTTIKAFSKINLESFLIMTESISKFPSISFLDSLHYLQGNSAFS
jgi:hypothetical protein